MYNEILYDTQLVTFIYNIGPQSQNTKDFPALFYYRKTCHGVHIWNFFLHYIGKKGQAFQHLELLVRYI